MINLLWTRCISPCLVFLFFLLLPLSLFAVTISVPIDYPTIQAAIDASQDGDTIIVQPGTYTENINYNGKAITITSTNPKDPSVVAATIIDGNSQGSVVTFSSGETTDSVLMGFTIQHGNGTLIDGKRYGGGIYCGNNSSATIRHNKIINNSADVGGGIYLQGNFFPTIEGLTASYPYTSPSQAITLTVTATDPDDDILTYTWTSTGTITGSGSSVSFLSNTPGVYPIKVTVADEHGGKAEGTVSITVIGITIQPLPQLIVGQPATLIASLTPVIADSPPYPVSVTWSLVQGAGSFDSTNGTSQAKTITFTPSSSQPGTLKVVYTVGSVPTSHRLSFSLNPVASTIQPNNAFQGETVDATITGNNLAMVTGIGMGSGVTATILDGKTETMLPVRVVIATDAVAGNRSVTLTTPEGTFTPSLIFQVKALPPITPNVSSLSLITGTNGTITFSIPSPAPSGGVTLTLASSAPSVASVPTSVIIPEGQTSVGVTITPLAYGTTTVTARGTGYAKADATVSVFNPPLITFAPTSLSVPETLTMPCIVATSNPAPSGGRDIYFSVVAGGTGTIDIPTKVTVPATQSSAQLNVKGLTAGQVTIKAASTDYPDATLPVTVKTPIPNGCGTTVAGTINTAGQKNTYTFTLTETDIVTIRATRSEGVFSPYLELYDPTGTLIAGNYRISMTLAAGTYTLQVRDSNNSGTGNYLLWWERLNSPCNVTAELTCGQPITGALGATTDNSPWKIYTFTVPTTQTVRLYLAATSETFYPRADLYTASGQLVTTISDRSPANVTLNSGNYALFVRDGYDRYSGNFVISWQSPLCATSISCGRAVSGTITYQNASNYYVFTVADNDVVTIRASRTSGNIQPQLELYNSSGTRVASGSLVASGSGSYDNAEFQINGTLAAGTYTLLVRDYNGSYTGDYLLYWQRLNNPCSAVALNCGQQISDSIGVTSDSSRWKSYTISLPADATIYAGVSRTSGNVVPYGKLYDASGEYVTDFPYGYRKINHPLSAGNYTLIIQDYYNQGVGDVSVSWQNFVTPCSGSATPISCGQTVRGTMAGAGSLNRYAFTVPTSDVVRVSLFAASGDIYPYADIYDSNSQYIDTTYGSGDVSLTAGNYTLIVYDSSGQRSGEFLIAWQGLLSPCSGSATQVACGQMVAGTIANVGDFDRYTFNVAANDVIAMRTIAISGNIRSCMSLYDASSGALLTHSCGCWECANWGDLDATLAAGTYALIVQDTDAEGTGDYALYWVPLNNPCVAPTTLNCGEPVSGSLGTTVENPPWRTFSFSVPTEETVRFYLGSSSEYSNLQAKLYDASGGLVESFWEGFKDIDLVAGNYRLVLGERYYQADTENFIISWQGLTAPCNGISSPIPTGCGQPVTGIIALPSAVNRYTFTVADNNVVTIRTIRTLNDISPYWELFDESGSMVKTPDGSYDESGADYWADVSLSAGTYTLTVQDVEQNNTGAYLLYWERTNSPCNVTAVLSCGQPVTGVLGSTSDNPPWKAYSLVLPANETVRLSLADVSDGAYPYVDIYDAAGQYVNGIYDSTNVDVSLTAGSYTLIVQRSGGQNAGNFALSWQPAGGSCNGP